MQIQELDPSVEVAHLRRLLDIQPVCLMRLGADGSVLAANDAALALLGVASGLQALGRDFAQWVPADQRERWKAFAAGVIQGGASSIECDIAARSGDRYPTLFHGVPLTEHPDGVPSLAVSARAVAGQRHLETAVVELEEQLRERDVERLKARARLAELESRRRELDEKVALLETRLRQGNTRPADDGPVSELRAELGRRAAELAEAESARHAAEAQAAAALADVRQLEVALEGFASRQKQMVAEREAERERVQSMSETMAAKYEQALSSARNLPERQRLAEMLQEREATVRALEAAWTEKRTELEAAQEARERLEADLREARQALAAAQQRDPTADEQGRALAARLDEAAAALQEREASLRQLKAAHERLAAAHASLTAEHERLVRELRQQAGRLEALVNDEPGHPGGAGAQEQPGSRAAGSEEERA